MSIDNVNEKNITGEDETQEKKDFLLSSVNFELLMKSQREIESATEMRPTFKKLINALVTEESINNITNKMIKQMSQ